jgi:Zn-dependent peptidase ImmA (M78 family)
MSKRINLILFPLAALSLATVLLLANYSSGAATPQKARVTTAMTRNAAIVATTAEVLEQTSEIRQLSILRPVKSGAESRADIERMLIKNLNEQMTPAEMHATEVALRKFGLAPSDFAYRPFIIKLLTEQVAGYYDPKVQEFHLADWLELETQKPVMAHELTHALQDQHFNLRRFEKWPHGDSDAELAAHALIEGDATLAMTMYMVKNPLEALAFSRALTTGVSTEQYNQAPRSMRESLIFPYLQGSEWATQVYKRGGWAMVSNAFTRLPLSSEQILHPEKYFKYEPPIKVVLPDVTSLLNGANSNQQSAISNQQVRGTELSSTGTAGVSPAVVRSKSSRRGPGANQLPTAHRPLPTVGWRRIDSDVNGEWSYYLILDQFLNSTAESKRAAAGWGGDRYALYEEPKSGQVFLAQLSVWDTETDAREFFDAYVKRTELRYPGATALGPSESKIETRNSERESRNVYSWDTSEGAVMIELRGPLVVILEGIPQGVDSKELLSLVLQ